MKIFYILPIMIIARLFYHDDDDDDNDIRIFCVNYKLILAE